VKKEGPSSDGPLYRPTCLDPGTHSLKNTSLFPLDILHSRLSHVLYGEVKLFKVKSLTGVAGEQWHLGRAERRAAGGGIGIGTGTGKEEGTRDQKQHPHHRHRTPSRTLVHSRTQTQQAVRSLAGNSSSSGFYPLSSWIRLPSTIYHIPRTVCRLPQFLRDQPWHSGSVLIVPW